MQYFIDLLFFVGGRVDKNNGKRFRGNKVTILIQQIQYDKTYKEMNDEKYKKNHGWDFGGYKFVFHNLVWRRNRKA